MKKLFALFITAAVLTPTLVSTAFAENITAFKDLPKSHWSYNTVLKVANDGYFKGYPDGRFLPDKQITRAEFISLFDNIVKRNFSITKSTEDLTMLSKLPDYKDVLKDNWVYNSVQNLWLYGRAFDKSDTDTRNTIDLVFGKDNLMPNQPITRAEVSALLYKLMNDSQANLSLPDKFKDTVNNKFAYPIQVLQAFGIITGYPDGTFKPNQGIKRSEAAAMIERLIDSKDSFKKIVWTSNSNYTYDTNLISPIDVAKKVMQLELAGKFDEAYTYYSDNSKKALSMNDYKDYMSDTNLHISKSVSYWSWERVNSPNAFTIVHNNTNQVKIKFIFVLEDSSVRGGFINLEKQDNKWFVVLENNEVILQDDEATL